MSLNQNNPAARQSAGSTARSRGKSPKRSRHPNIDLFLSVVSLATITLIGVSAGIVVRDSRPDRERAAVAYRAKEPATVAAPPVVAAADQPMTGQWTDDAVDLRNPQAPVTVERTRRDDVSIFLITGGVAGSRRALTRHGVTDFVKDAGAAAGLNGTFFANASLNGTDNLLIGPSLCGDEAQVVIGPFDKRPALNGRPMVMLSPMRTMICPYNPITMDNDIDVRTQMPEVSDAFLGGVWLVHNGAAASDSRIASFHVKDANDFRRRAFFALMPDGRPALGASDCSVSSRELARALADMKVREAVLLDSGFSTSLVYGNQILVSGHSTPRIPSRPVPHAVLLFGSTTTAQMNTSLHGPANSAGAGVKS